ncbi:MAG: tRNA pseudouridine(38-40) synthase TruA [Spirochaetaceae bacterium]|jgi:tRNA pseudouridine38-40 synthase|nr:tRNA pseudouridine(38-40) synthase TruA [Spirochaetaceae bacterium]
MPRIALLVSYDGTSFAGWQRQKNDPTVQQALENSLKKLTGQTINIHGSGRTDAGVHATGQVAHFDLKDSNIPTEKIHLAINSHLPREISVLKACGVDGDFHSRYDAKKRQYGYYIFNGPVLPAPYRDHCFAVRHPLNLKTLNSIASVLTGIHDFSSFAAAGDKSESKVRELFQAHFIRRGDFLIFKIQGNAFLWKMVRSLTGTIIDLCKKDRGSQELLEILKSKDRDNVGPTAPPGGLFLENVDYGSKCSFY